MENVYESAGVGGGEAVNRRSDLLLNPDLLQNCTMGDYEADYCGWIYWDDVTHYFVDNAF